jgi:hypothetical protein
MPGQLLCIEVLMQLGLHHNAKTILEEHSVRHSPGGDALGRIGAQISNLFASDAANAPESILVTPESV